jgi:hypothetical protein
MSSGWYGVEPEAEMPLQLLPVLLAMIDAQVVADQVHRRHQRENLPVEVFQEGDEFLSASAAVILSMHSARCMPRAANGCNVPACL